MSAAKSARKSPPSTPPTGEAPPDRLYWANINRPFSLGFFVVLGGLLAILLGTAIGSLSTILINIMFALFAALGLDPAVRALQKRNLSRTGAIAVVCVVFVVLMLGVGFLIVPTVVGQVSQFIQALPSTIATFQQSDVFQWIETNLGGQTTDLLGSVQSFFQDPGNLAAVGGGVLQFGVSIGTGVSAFIIIVVLALYFLASLDTMKAWFYRMFPARNRPRIEDLTEQITGSIGGYVIGMVTLAFFNAVVAFLLHLILGLPFPALFGVLAFLITLIPLIGSVLYLFIATAAALLTNPVAAMIFAIAYLIYMQIEAYVLTPRVMNRSIAVPGALVIIGALVGGTLLGLLGALIAIPVTASILLIIKQVFIPRQDARV